MKAGRELDKQVHIHVMGGSFDPNSSYPWDDIKPYSTNREAAWLVVEKLEKDGIMLWHLGREDSMPNWRVSFGRQGKPDQRAEAETVPLAICMAALAHEVALLS